MFDTVPLQKECECGECARPDESQVTFSCYLFKIVFCLVCHSCNTLCGKIISIKLSVLIYPFRFQ